MIKKFFIALAIVLLPVLAQAQTVCANPCTVAIGEPFTVAADHNGVGATEYRLYISNSLVLTVPASSLANGVVRFPIPAGMPATVPVGTYSVQAASFDGTAEARSTAIQLIVAPKPALVAPSNTRVTKP